MRKFFLLIAIVNILAGFVGFLLFVVLGGFDLYLGKGTPVWLSFIPSVFLIASVLNFAAAFLLIHIKYKIPEKQPKK